MKKLNSSISTKVLLLVSVFLLLIACDGNKSQREDVSGPVLDNGRWYEESQVRAGAIVFAENCAQCHGAEAQGLVSDWRIKLEDGSFPPPPLNGTAHAWHHSRSILLQVINNGGVEFGGNMPGFADILSANEKLEVIAYFQNFWTEEIYQQWVLMGGTD